MGYVKFDARRLDEPHWIEAGPAAFTIHVWALSYCNEQATDGRIPIKRAHRLVCPVEPADIPDAFAQLIDLGVWRVDGVDYVCDAFLLHGLAADEQQRTRAKWALDKKRRHLHSVGNHELCTPNSKCSVARAQVESTSGNKPTSQMESNGIHRWKSGRLDQTRPDPTPKGEGRVAARDRGEGGSAEAAPPTRVVGFCDVCALPPSKCACSVFVPEREHAP